MRRCSIANSASGSTSRPARPVAFSTGEGLLRFGDGPGLDAAQLDALPRCGGPRVPERAPSERVVGIREHGHVVEVGRDLRQEPEALRGDLGLGGHQESGDIVPSSGETRDGAVPRGIDARDEDDRDSRRHARRRARR